MDFHDHIVVNIFGGASSTLIGLQDFVMPLRTSNFTYEELKQIVFIGHIKYLKREWKTIQNFPKLFIFPGSGLSWANLRAVSVQRCCMSVIMSSNFVYENKRYLEDTECILATLNLSSMQFKETSNIAALRFLDDKKEHASRIPVITELKQASNITFIEQENSTLLKHPETKFFMTAAFATGSIFSPCFLDSLMCMAYFDRKLLALLQILVTGGTTPEVEDQLAEENRQTKSLSSEFCSPWDRCKLSIIPVTDSRLSPVNGNTYEYLFNKALISLGIICFGIYRLMDAPNRRQSRYVITRPPKNFPLLATDMLYCIVPYRVQPCATQSLESLSPMENGSTIHSKEDLSDTSEDESATSFKVYM
ncbi:calcium-activated potassium channel subunit alpha-1-like [Bombina bombina]|uniref:calcium-activated potassium channel subunit alpha-1-like n=1 Tax=Bombina bombina TaxID=8345 RepID=UPI00235AA17B|nr:calcium-activated potassium channel subunit alpha-1-like [Bombina bombina]